MLLTPRLGLRKPQNTDSFGQDDFNVNADLVDAIAIGVSVFHSVNQSLASGVDTALAFDSERFDDPVDPLHDPASNNSRLTCRVAGRYLAGGSVRFASNGTGFRRLQIVRNGTGVIVVSEPAPSSVDSLTVGVVKPVALGVGDYIELQARQDSGGALNVVAAAEFSPQFWMVRVG